MRKRFVGIVVSLWICHGVAFAGNLMTPFNNVCVEAKRGDRVDIRGPGNKGLLLFNRENRSVAVTIAVIAPVASDLPKGTIPIPDLGWVTLGQTQATLSANDEKEIAVRIQVPREWKWKGKTIAFFVWTKAAPVDGAGVHVQAALLSRVYVKIR